MAKYFGSIGFVDTVETAPGVWEEKAEERAYFGDVIRNTRRWQSAETLNDNRTISNEISIVADPYAFQHTHAIRYITWLGALWQVSSIDVQYPRLVLSIGGVYNGKQAETAYRTDECSG